MECACLYGYGTVDMAVQIRRDIAIPTNLESHDVMIRIAAASIHPSNLIIIYIFFKDFVLVDLKLISGNLKLFCSNKWPKIIGFDFSGIVSKVGDKCKRLKEGDRVWGFTPLDETGSCAEFLKIQEKFVGLMPDNLNFNEAASLPMNGSASYSAVFNSGKIREGHRVLVIGASGGVGNCLVQIAKSVKANVVGVCSGKNLEIVKGFLGADDAVDYQMENWWEKFREDSEEKKFDLVFDTIGGKETWNRSQSVLKRDGRFITFVGDDNAADAKMDISNTLSRIGKVISRKSMSLVSKPNYYLISESPNLEHLDALKKLVEEGNLNPLVGPKFGLNDIFQALKLASKGSKTSGSIIVVMNSAEDE
jgi:alcohol dehydrogenase